MMGAGPSTHTAIDFCVNDRFSIVVASGVSNHKGQEQKTFHMASLPPFVTTRSPFRTLS